MSVTEAGRTDRVVGARSWGSGWGVVCDGDRASVIQSAKSPLDGWRVLAQQCVYCVCT